MKATDRIIQEIAGKPFSLKDFFRENLAGILTTIIFHLGVIIVFLLFKIGTYRQVKELGVVLDFTYEMEEREPATNLTEEEQAKLAMYERILERTLRVSNQPVNISEQLEKAISTDNFVDEVERMLNESRSEEERRQLEEMEKKVAAGIIEPERQMNDLQHITEYQGPTRISYEFYNPPLQRYGTYIPVPVYKCQGGGVVEVEISVDQSGSVTSAKPVVIGSPIDAACLAEAAVKYALLSRFSRSGEAPKGHRGKIRYSFVAQ